MKLTLGSGSEERNGGRGQVKGGLSQGYVWIRKEKVFGVSGARMKCVSDYYIELSFCMRFRVTRLWQKAALGEFDEFSKQIS